jgi:hypothetical protein
MNNEALIHVEESEKQKQEATTSRILERAYELIKQRRRIVRHPGNIWCCQSQVSESFYKISWSNSKDRFECDCEFYRRFGKTHSFCKHILSVAIASAGEQE